MKERGHPTEEVDLPLLETALQALLRRAKHPQTIRFETFAKESFLGVYAPVNNKPSEIASKTSILEGHLLPIFGKRCLGTIKAQDIEQYKARKLAEGLSAKSVNNHLAVLSKLLRVAEEWEIITRAPRVKLLRIPDPNFCFLDFEETERLLAALDPEWRALVLFALRTGLRQGEIRALKWEDIDGVSPKVLVRRSAWNDIIGTPKGGRSREVPLSDEVILALKGLLKREPYVFSHPSGRMWRRSEMKWPLWRACKTAGLQRIGWHVLRHTFASHLVMRGVPLKAVQELLGHRDIRMTMRYSHLAPGARRDAVEKLSQPAPEWREHFPKDA